ncbi:hypothetical protein BSKO_02863 [Bryopsis sp. KO-2023]|nr:hypothetical protein BSKO_02863 [Bryopsis sp. KO-2023]
MLKEPIFRHRHRHRQQQQQQQQQHQHQRQRSSFHTDHDRHTPIRAPLEKKPPTLIGRLFRSRLRALIGSGSGSLCGDLASSCGVLQESHRPTTPTHRATMAPHGSVPRFGPKYCGVRFNPAQTGTPHTGSDVFQTHPAQHPLFRTKPGHRAVRGHCVAFI